MTLDTPNFTADILIVDDKLENIRFLSEFLLGQNYQVRKAINGQAALTAAKTVPPDLILLDINMPGMSGYEVCTQLKQDPQTSAVPVIFLSAGSNVCDKVQGFQVGGVDYITKPFQLEEVLIRVQTQLTIRQLQQTLEHKNQQLNDALAHLKAHQVALVQQEKMATLRKVVAGVAHEINNPLSFIAGNIEPIREYKTHLLTLLDLYQRQCTVADPAIKALQDELDLGFLSTDFDKIIDSMKHGAERINTVVLALRIFTRLNESGIKQINIHECIDTTLTLLRHRLQFKNVPIQVQKTYGTLPYITCYAEQMTQVLFNLLCNAIDAVEVKQSRTVEPTYCPEISIRTELTAQHQLVIRIKDNGIGIPEELRSQLFEPFFTTKAAGQGVGLGLAISQRIIEEIHGGQLSYRSIPDRETEFTIQIPA